MPDPSDPTTVSARAKTSSQLLRERRGGVPPELIERRRNQNAVRRRLTEALRVGPRTVPELASEVDVPSQEVLWHLMGMKKYGKVVEADQADGYFKYQLIDEPGPSEKKS